MRRQAHASRCAATPRTPGTVIIVQHATLVALAPPGSRAAMARARRSRDRRDVRQRTRRSRARCSSPTPVRSTRAFALVMRTPASSICSRCRDCTSRSSPARRSCCCPRARASRVASTWLALLVTLIYIVVIGAPAPAVRSAVMLGATRRVPPNAATHVPVGGAGARRLGTARESTHHRRSRLSAERRRPRGAHRVGALARRLLAGRVSGWRRVIARDLIASTLASIVTLPLIAWTFGRLSIVAPLTNLAAGPIFTVLQPTLFLALLLSPFPAVAIVPGERRSRACCRASMSSRESRPAFRSLPCRSRRRSRPSCLLGVVCGFAGRRLLERRGQRYGRCARSLSATAATALSSSVSRSPAAAASSSCT